MEECLLGELTLIDQQSGFSGNTGVIWSIDVDGKYRASHFMNERVDQPYKQGQLDPAELCVLKNALEADLLPLRAQLGVQAEINPRTIVIRFAKETWTLALPAGQSFGNARREHFTNENDPRHRFLAVVRVVLDSMGEQPQ